MLRDLLPYFVYKRLWGDRAKNGLTPIPFDNDWKVWLDKGYTDFYQNTQEKGIGEKVCNTGYTVVQDIDFLGKTVLEIGPGRIKYLPFLRKLPEKLIICDIEKRNLDASIKILEESNISYSSVLLDRNYGGILPFDSNSIDVCLSFYSLEHLHPLNTYLKEFHRVIKASGIFAGAIPCEGGLAWGLGRYLTTRRYVHSNYGIDYDKIISWEHPNYADCILEGLSKYFDEINMKKSPFRWLPLDFNLVTTFVAKKQ